ncbi:MAG: hydroxypyruvate isomerase [Actinomycetota bacterium]|jgi:hydroxypyruvate isomerase|nr:hydroxypyruvate isomerase [Actinomycetota bacterium]
MVLELSASIPALYGSRPFAAACAAAAADGFACVELWAPPERPDWPAALTALDARGLSLTSVNAPAGAPPAFGTAAAPTLAESWRAEVMDALEFARLAGATAINVLAGARMPGHTRADQLACLRENLKWLLDLLDDSDPVLLLEPLNTVDRCSPLLGRIDDAIAVLDQLGSDRLRLLFDAYHVHQEEPDLLPAFDRALPYIGHVQVADFPGRAQPGTGTLAWPSLIAEIVKSGYQGRIGCEFVPTCPDAVALARAYLTALQVIEAGGAT